ncbi:exporter of polyketide antibiotics [Microbacterium kribbense]|uniref:Exporter of polyketide antibiotics n=1 Tax=Microbacterium kribbense TaxID=433645 RepID=A0ABP7GRQ4_9MICO
MSVALAGTRPLLRASLHHDGRLFAPWILFATLLSASSVLAYPWIFPSAADRAGLSTAIGANPALGLIFGPAFDLSTTDGFNAWRSLAIGGFLAALGAIFSVTRATRAQEDSGQAELLASGVMGRVTRLMAGVAIGLLGSVLMGAVAGLVTVACGGDWTASMLLAATFTATGWMFTGAAAIAAQLGSDARTANSIAIGTLGVLFLLRGFAYAVDAPAWTIWINPLGWMTETRPASGDNGWPLLPAVALTAALLAVAFVLQARRDFGVGAIAPRPGPAHGADRSAWRLALRLNRPPLLTWTIAFIALGLVFGYFTTSIHDILGQNPAVQHILAAGATTPDALVGAFVVTVLSLVGIIAAVPGVQTMLKVRSEELADRVEPVIAAGGARTRYYAAHVVVALAAPAGYILIAGTLIATLAASADIGVGFGDVLLQALVTVPAVCTVVAVSVAVVGARPQITLAAWLGVLVSFALTLLGPTFKLWDWILAISPFWHVPHVTAAAPDLPGMLWVGLVALVLMAIGFARFRRRDLAR